MATPEQFAVQLYGHDGTQKRRVLTTSSGSLLCNLGFDIPAFDDVVLGYTGTNITSVTYKKDGDTVATLELTYTDGNLTRIRKI